MALKCFVGLEGNINELDCAPLFESPLCVNATSSNGVTFTCNHKAAVQRLTSGVKGTGCKVILTGKKKVKYTYCACDSDLCNSASTTKEERHQLGIYEVTSKCSSLNGDSSFFRGIMITTFLSFKKMVIIF